MLIDPSPIAEAAHQHREEQHLAARTNTRALLRRAHPGLSTRNQIAAGAAEPDHGGAEREDRTADGRGRHVEAELGRRRWRQGQG